MRTATWCMPCNEEVVPIVRRLMIRLFVAIAVGGCWRDHGRQGCVDWCRSPYLDPRDPRAPEPNECERRCDAR
jgi:hypothetical protein